MSNKSWRKRWIYDSDVSVPRTSKWRRKNEEIQGEDDDADLRQKTTSMHEITDLRENISPLKQRKILPSCSVREEQLEKREHTQKSSLCDPIINSSNTKFNATKHFIQGSQPTCNLIEEGGSSMDNIDYENFDIAAISASAGSVALDVQTSKDLIDQITWQNTVYEEELDNEEANVQPNDDQCLPDIEGGPLIDNINLKEDIPDMKSFSTHIQNQEETIDNESLYDNSTLKTDESSLLIMAFAVRHKLSGVALEDLLKLIELHCPKPNKCTTEIKEFKMFFQALKHPIVYHYYCPNTVCQNYTGTSVPIESDKCEVCETYLSKSAYFIEIPIKEQIKTIFSRKEMLEKLHYRFQREKDDDSIEDVFDGELYKMHFSPGKFLWDPHNISLLGNTDGVALIKSTSYGVWPVYFVINELPPKERIRRSNRIFSGLWFGKGKPHFPTFLRPFSMSLRNLYFKGVRITDTIMMKAIVLEMSVDSPARAVWQAIKQFNGYHGCGKCKEPGEQLDLGPGKGKSRRSSHIYPFNKEFAATTGHKGLRSHDEVKKQALEAIRNKPHNKKFAVEGVVGLSWGFGLPMFDVIKGTVVDYMHCVCEGVVDQLLSKWLNKTNSKEAFYLGNKIDQISKELKAIRPTLEITRTPRSLADVKQWKASEKRAFLLYYSVPLLSPYLSSDYLHSLMMLSGGVFRLLKQSISRSDIEEASTYLRLFTALAPVYYGKQFQTFNVHQLLHLPEVVKDAGPLWSNSCFPFEDYNGDLRDLFHGSNNVDGQIVTAVSVTQKLPEIAQATTTSSEVRAFYDHLTSKRSNACSLKDKIEENAHVLGSLERVWGTTSSKLLSEKQMAAIPKHHGKLWVFRRCFIGGVIFHSKSYKRVVARNDFTVKCRQGEEELYGSVDTYVKLEEKCMNARCIDRMCTCHLSSRYVAIIEVLESHVEQLPRYRERTVVNHIIRVNPTNRLIAVPVTNILEKFIKVDVPSGSFICLLPNHYEKD